MLDKIGNVIVTLVLTFVPSQWGKDLAKMLQVVITVVQEAENKHGKGAGEAKRKEAIEAFMKEVEKDGGLDLPTIITGDMGRRMIGLLIDGLIAMVNHKRGN